MSRLGTIANWLSVAAAFAFAGAVVLADTTIGSPRSVVMSIAGVIVAVVQLLHALEASRLLSSQIPPGLQPENAPGTAKSPS